MLERRMWRALGKCVGDYSLITPGDHVAVGVSGGKDSLSLLHLLHWHQHRSPVRYQLSAVTVDLGLGADFSGVNQFCMERSIPYVVQTTDIGKIVFEIRQESNPCALCANLRRGALYGQARALGCNKVALAHHLDDAIETLFLNLFFQGRLACFHPRTYLSRQDLTVIRPLVYTEERALKDFAISRNLPIVLSPCPAEEHTQRRRIKAWIGQLEPEIPRLHQPLRTALMGLWQDAASWSNNQTARRKPNSRGGDGSFPGRHPEPPDDG